jgi:hypothetical protein
MGYAGKATTKFSSRFFPLREPLRSGGPRFGVRKGGIPHQDKLNTFSDFLQWIVDRAFRRQPLSSSNRFWRVAP